MADCTQNLGHKIGGAVQIFVKIFKISLILMFINIVDLIFYRE